MDFFLKNSNSLLIVRFDRIYFDVKRVIRYCYSLKMYPLSIFKQILSKKIKRQPDYFQIGVFL
jgi:hypothetical protein